MAAVGRRDFLPHMHGLDQIGSRLGEVVGECCEIPAKLKEREPDEAAVHRARQALKRARAVLRASEDLDVPHAKITRRRLARLARKLSPLRDATVSAKMAGKFLERVGGIAQQAVAMMSVEPKSRRTDWWAPWKRKLAIEARHTRTLDWQKITAHDVERALRRSAQRVCRRADEAHDIATAHAWRKAVIVLREQVATVRPLLGGDASELHDSLHELAHLLGRATDLNVFLEAVRSRRWPKKLRRAHRKLEAFLCRKRKRAIKRAQQHWPDVRALLKREFG